MIFDRPKSDLYKAVKSAVEENKDVDLVIDGVSHKIKLLEYSVELNYVILGRVKPSVG